MELNYLL